MQKAAPSVEQINNELPQTQCQKCGFDGCKPYAHAILNGEPINQCPPGGDQVIRSIAKIMSKKPVPLNPSHGVFEARKVAVIREEECIGCTKCLPACPVDAILGSAKRMHVVITAECSGCDLCIDPCPVNCIEMKPISEEEKLKDFSNTLGSISQKLSAQWAIRHNNKNIRAARSAYSLPPKKSEQLKPISIFSREKALTEIQEAIVRVRERKKLLKLRASGKTDES